MVHTIVLTPRSPPRAERRRRDEHPTAALSAPYVATSSGSRSKERPTPAALRRTHAFLGARALRALDHPGGCRRLSTCCRLGAAHARAGLRQRFVRCAQADTRNPLSRSPISCARAGH